MTCITCRVFQQQLCCRFCIVQANRWIQSLHNKPCIETQAEGTLEILHHQIRLHEEDLLFRFTKWSIWPYLLIFQLSHLIALTTGNLAHMLNHSCQPNCYSRTIEIINHKDEPEEHVVIVAKEEIPALQELTYDYRFFSTEILPCNCGAEKCCGFVNESSAADLGSFRVPLGHLRPLKIKS